MTREEFEIALRRWGWVHGERPEVEPSENDRTPAVHPIARAMEFGTRGTGRRLDPAYARKVLPGERVWSRDPIPCAETRPAVGAAPANHAPRQDDPAHLIQAAWLELYARDMRTAGIVRLEYQVRDGQAEKARSVGIGRGQYREMLAEGKGWIFARITMPLAA